jgi:hypothetical protein
MGEKLDQKNFKKPVDLKKLGGQAEQIIYATN